MKNDFPFGGKIVVLGGDFRQILPVLPKKGRCDIVNATLKRSPLWSFAEQFRLTINERVRRCGESLAHARFAEFVLRLGDGSMNNQDGLVKIPNEFIHHGTAEDLLLFSQPLIKDGVFDAESAILCPTNESADYINSLALEMLGGSSIKLYSTDRLADDSDRANSVHFPIEFLNSIDVSGLPPHELRLREGVPVILLRNLNTSQGLCNGTRLRVIALMNNVIKAEVITGPAAGKKVLIPRIPMSPSDNVLPVQMIRRQFPIRLAFAMTINKSQGQTLKKVALYLPKPVFSHGQLYVGTSRTGDPRNFRIMIVPKPGEQGYVQFDGEGYIHYFTKNVVYPEVLR
jgi:ATP-dependent DNA helicase PIF1